jgi:hypothetical protein
MKPLRNSAGEIIGLLATYRDVTARRTAGDERVRVALELAVAGQAAAVSRHDALTGLPDRGAMTPSLRHSLEAAIGGAGRDVKSSRDGVWKVDVGRKN